MCVIPVITFMLGSQQQTLLPTLQPKCANFIFAFLLLAILIVAELFFRPPLLSFTLSPIGIEHTQQVTTPGARNFWHVWTELGGGREIWVLLAISLWFSSRSRFMYYLSVYTMNQFYIQFFKLAYHHPRPYMIDGNIVPYTCSKGFGNPSGHSSSSSLFAIMLYLDLFHGSHVSNDR